MLAVTRCFLASGTHLTLLPPDLRNLDRVCHILRCKSSKSKDHFCNFFKNKKYCVCLHRCARREKRAAIEKSGTTKPRSPTCTARRASSGSVTRTLSVSPSKPNGSDKISSPEPWSSTCIPTIGNHSALMFHFPCLKLFELIYCRIAYDYCISMYLMKICIPDCLYPIPTFTITQLSSFKIKSLYYRNATSLHGSFKISNT